MVSNVYKLLNEQNGKLTKTNYTRKGAIAKRKYFDEKGIKTKIIVYKQGVKILDTTSDFTGIIDCFTEIEQKEKK